MTTTTMHFGPEWMRKQPAPSRPPHSDPQSVIHAPEIALNNTTVGSLVSGASALSPAPSTAPVPPESRDKIHPFRYSREDMIRIYKGGGRGVLGSEIEKWDGIVREVVTDPVGLKELDEAEKKLFMGSLNSEIRRRQSTDYLTPLATSGLDRPKSNHASTPNGVSPMRERFGALMGQRRRDSSDQPSLSVTRKLSVSSPHNTLNSPRDAGHPSPRTRSGPGFDGVLGSGESWTSRRRGSEATATGTHIRELGGTNGHVDQASEIQVEVKAKLEGIDKPQIQAEPAMTGSDIQQDLVIESTSHQYEAGHKSISDDFINDTEPMLLNESDTTAVLAGGMPAAVERLSLNPSDVTDLASLEWSYLDTHGQIQGPFRADTMQSWSDQGYFTPELLMRRTNIDSEWISVAELQKRASGPKVFLSPLTTPPPPCPPGLLRRQDPPINGLSQIDTGSSSYQSVTTRSLRASTLDSFVNGISNHSDSPSSSFSTGRFGNGSPDPSTVEGRIGNSMFSAPEAALAQIGAIRRSTYTDSSFDPTGVRSFSNGPPRAASFDYAFNDPVVDTSLGGPSSLGKASYIVNPVDQKSAGSSPFLGHDGLNNAGVVPNLTNGFQSHGAHSQGQPLSGTHSMQYAQHVVGNLSQPAPSVQTQPYASSLTSQSPWNVPDTTGLKKPGPFDPLHPTSRNTIVRQPSPWERNTGVPWIGPRQGSSPDSWNESTSSLTFRNLEQHNQQQQDLTPSTDVVAATDSIAQPGQKPSQNAETITAGRDVAPLDSQASNSRRKSPPHAKSPQPLALVPKSPTLPLSSPSAQHKPAWSREDEIKKLKPPGVAIGFREIHEAETKKAEARKAAGRDRERAARVAISASNDESSTFTASWGLPTSQVHGNRNGTVKDAPPGQSQSIATPATPPVWTSTAKPPVAKKTMKEIQEEEEKRKKLEAMKEKETVGTAVRRAYAENTNKAVPVPSTGPAWTTVGANGKTNTSQARPPIPSLPPTLNTSGSTVAARPINGTVVPSKPSASKSATATQRMDETSVDPSHEFLRWLGDSLKGLNASVNLEDIASMLLSFPLDADSSTMEIISDLIYANSTTLDGRRFASEFVTKRKADSLSRLKGHVAIGAPGKPPSIADIVKAQPKPAQNEWGGFKVVNKKKKGGRS